MEPCARFELTYPDYKSGASPSMLTGLTILEPMERIERSSVAYQATALPLSYIGWSQRGYRNPDLRITGAALCHLSYSGLERVRRIELRLPDWRSDAQPIGHTRRNSGAGGDNRNLFSGLEAQGTPYVPRPHEKHIQLSKTTPGTQTSTLQAPCFQGQAGPAIRKSRR